MLLPVTVNNDATLPIQLTDSGAVKTGVLFGDVVCHYSKAGAALAEYTIDTDNWTEIGQGLYTIDFTDSELDILGWFKYLVTSATADFDQAEYTVFVEKRGQVRFSAVYNETTTDLVIRAWLEIDGEIVTAPTSVSISIKDDTEVEQWSLADSSPSADGFFTITSSSPVLSDDHNYSCNVAIIYSGNTYTSGDCLLTVA